MRRISQRVERQSKLLEIELNSNKHILEDLHHARPTKKVKTSPLKVSNCTAAARQALKDKQLLKEKRRKPGVVKTSQSIIKNKYAHIQSRIDTNRTSTVLNKRTNEVEAPLKLTDLDPIIEKKEHKPSSHLHRSRYGHNQISTNSIMSIDKSVAKGAKNLIEKDDYEDKENIGSFKNDSAIDLEFDKSITSCKLKQSTRLPIILNDTKTLIIKHFEKSNSLPLIIKPKIPREYHDPLLLEEYEDDIYIYLREIELVTMPDPVYIHKQRGLDWSMRHKLVSWIIEVHAQFRLKPETLFLTVNLIDRTLSNHPISISKLQLVGVTSLLVASKYEEIMSPSLSDLVYMTDNAYDENEIIRAEIFLLGIVGYQIGYPNPLNFLRRLMKNKEDKKVEQLASYFLELLMLGSQFLKYPPSLCAAAALFLSIKSIYEGEWSAELEKIIGYSEENLLACVYQILEYMKSEETRILYEKYSLPAYGGISTAMYQFLKYKNLI